jgi:hypothetical protein
VCVELLLQLFSKKNASSRKRFFQKKLVKGNVYSWIKFAISKKTTLHGTAGQFVNQAALKK